MPSGRALAVFGFSVAFAFAGAGRAGAVPVTWTFEGNLQVIEITRGGPNVPEALTSLGVAIGAPVSGFIRFESGTPDTRPEADNAAYRGAIDSAALTIGDWSLANGVYLPYPEFTAADIFVAYYTGLGIEASAAIVDTYDVTQVFSDFSFFALQWEASHPGVISSDAMLLDPPDLADLVPFGYDPFSAYGYGTDIFVAGCSPSLCIHFNANVTSLERVGTTPPMPAGFIDVPEPGAGVLAALAFAALRSRR